MSELPKAYDASKEREIYSKWEETGLFDPDKMREYLEENGYEIKKPFTITLPPPNANGDLHLGHTCGYSFHDVMGRYMRMTGHPTLLLPGKDHAGIQTETAFSKKIQEEGTTKWELGREEFYKQCYEFTMKNAQNAQEQEKNIGLSADYSRELFTLDPKLTKIVYETFYKMYEDGLVYRDKRIINQCPECRTALADIDTEHEMRRGIFAYIRYPLVEKEDVSHIETIVFDVNGVLGEVNPERERKMVKLLKVSEEELEYLDIRIRETHKLNENKFDEEAFWLDIKQHYKASQDSIDEIRSFFTEHFDKYEEIFKLIRKLEKGGYKIGLITNGNSNWVHSYFKQIEDWDEIFSFQIYVGDEDCKGKHCNEIYERFTARNNLDSKNVLLVDDSIKNIKIAKSLGWDGFYFQKDIFELEKYINNGVRYITVATTRPETMLGDTAVAVHPDDERYKEYVGKKVILPIANREIPIIADEEVDMEKGTGAVKVTPAHSPVDFDLGQRHDLEIINVINEEGKMAGEIPERFIGMETIECSKALCSELEKEGLLEKIENIKHEVTVCERCRTAIEPIISNQWYIDVSDLAKRALKELKEGNVKVLPEGQQRALEHFYENIQPWCISRQLWWGQRIPIWYKGSKKKYDEEGTEIHLGENPPDESGDWEPETDMFDTWFSSGQWPYSTLGGPDGEDYKRYYPTQLMIHARDILFWWSARMIMMGLYRTDQLPYPQIFLTGMILAEDGSKMSKSKGNGVEPTEVFDRYGADALRLWYYSDALPGSNAPLREEKIKGNRNFVNKIWNASRFIVMNIEDKEVEDIVKCEIDDNLERVKSTREHIRRVGEYIERYQFNLGAELIREFFWHTLCDVWIEEVKNEIQSEDVGSDIRVKKLSELLFVLKENLKIMHPFIPFVTEAVWQELVNLGLANDTLMEQQI